MRTKKWLQGFPMGLKTHFQIFSEIVREERDFLRFQILKTICVRTSIYIANPILRS